MKRSTLGIVSILLLTFCGDVEHEIHPFKLYKFGEGTILTFQSDASTEEFIVQKIVNGRYEDSRSGTCGKPRLDIYYFQAVHLRSLDSLDRQTGYIPVYFDDCAGYFDSRLLRNTSLISSLVSEFQPIRNDIIQWLDEFKAPISSFTQQHPRLTLREKRFTNVFEYEIPDGKRLAKIFYTMRHGFVGYQLKNGTVFELTNKLP